MAAASGFESPRVYRAAGWLLAGSASFDYLETARGMSHPPILHFTQISNGVATPVNLNFTSSYVEGGWARVVGSHDICGVIAVSVAADALAALAARRLVRAGPRWRVLGTAVLLFRSWSHITGGTSWMGYSNRLAAPYSQFSPVWQP